VILLVAVALLQAAPAPAGPEIVVVGRQLQQVSVVVGRDPAGKFRCSLSASSGRRSVDAALCKSAAKCAKQGEVETAAMRACIEARKPTILTEFAERVRTGKE
jgi:hypothetical protein